MRKRIRGLLDRIFGKPTERTATRGGLQSPQT